ncbi:MAG: hypothetical protein M1549_01260 [Candidatus Dependentiae bacterium]|nr:hypothetical protein [Candidatus Dependentiae bacterium]
MKRVFLLAYSLSIATISASAQGAESKKETVAKSSIAENLASGLLGNVAEEVQKKCVDPLVLLVPQAAGTGIFACVGAYAGNTIASLFTGAITEALIRGEIDLKKVLWEALLFRKERQKIVGSDLLEGACGIIGLVLGGWIGIKVFFPDKTKVALSTLKREHDEFKDQTNRELEDTKKSIEERLDRTNESLTEKIDENRKSLLNEFQKRLNTQSAALQNSLSEIEKKQNDIGKQIVQFGELFDLKQELSVQTQKKIQESLEEQLKCQEEGQKIVGGKIDEIKDRVNGVDNRLNGFQQGAQGMQEKLEKLRIDIGKKIDDNSLAIEFMGKDILKGVTEGVEKSLNNKFLAFMAIMLNEAGAQKKCPPLINVDETKSLTYPQSLELSPYQDPKNKRASNPLSNGGDVIGKENVLQTKSPDPGSLLQQNANFLSAPPPA